MLHAAKKTKDWTPVDNGIFYSQTTKAEKYMFAGNIPMCDEVKDFLRIAAISVLTTENRTILQTMSLPSSLHSTGDHNVGCVTHSNAFQTGTPPLGPVQKPTGTEPQFVEIL